MNESRSGALTLEGAKKAAAHGSLHMWLQCFLRSPEGLNTSLADYLESTLHAYEGPTLLELSKLHRIAGPEPGLRWPWPRQEWEADVVSKVRALQTGWEPPPLIADATSYGLSDGNRRFEALVRQRIEAYWTILIRHQG
jgi:hypothetical protein